MRSTLVFTSVAALLAATAPAATAQGPANTGYQLSGVSDLNWKVAFRRVFGGSDGGSGAAVAISSGALPGVWAANESNARWIAPATSANLPGGVGDGAVRYEYTFSTTFTLAQASRISGRIGFDNRFLGIFDGGTIDPVTYGFSGGTQVLSPTTLLGAGNEGRFGFCRADGFDPYPVQNCSKAFMFDLAAGTHTLNVRLNGDGATDGLFLAGLTTSPVTTTVPEPASLVLVGSGIAGMMMRRRTGRTTA